MQMEEPTPDPTPVAAAADDPESAPAAESDEDKREDKDSGASNHGTLILDATCAPADIQYPTGNCSVSRTGLTKNHLEISTECF